MGRLTSKELLEKEIEGKVAKLFPFIVFQKLYKRSWPDRLVLLPGGRCFFVEFKVKDEPLRPDQELVKKALEERSFTVYVVDRITQGIRVISRELLRQQLEF
jgi:hypothetical protein